MKKRLSPGDVNKPLQAGAVEALYYRAAVMAAVCGIFLFYALVVAV